MREAHRLCQLVNMVHNHKINANREKYIKSSINNSLTQIPKPHSILKGSQRRPSNNKNSLTNYPERCQQPDHL